ncbi:MULTISPECIES: PLP-dependent aminotransferase family protein [unclassified Bradyrhizobium]|uniref:aminotransferase-like domain-containing protein n=1 Tax=unclassified Bradyrhizobium TaxID=2631580 RepID=UPI0028F10C50|nr:MULTISPECIES: PLP-dependent aminotransferase family protein [unclassified Bradyrhizobium]
MQLELSHAGALRRSYLHASLSGSTLEAVNFLNEVIDRFPDAISFAPGAPHPQFFDNLDVGYYIDRYTKHLAQERGLTPNQVRRRLYQYGASRGQICDLVADALRIDNGITVSPQSVVITVGAQEAMLLVLRALRTNSDDLLAAVTPCFMGIVGAARLLDMEIIPIDEGTTGINLSQLRAMCQAARAEGRRVRAVYVAPDFANPSGTLMTLSSRQELLELALSEDFLILEDSTYGFTSAVGALPPLKQLDRNYRVIYIGTFSKICLPGARVGFVIADQPVIDVAGGRVLADELSALKTMVTVNTSPICQAVIGGMLLDNGGSLGQVIAEKAPVYRRNLRLLLDALYRYVECHDDVRWNTPLGGFFVRLRLPVVVDDALVELSARQFGVLWTPMAHFHLSDFRSHELRLSCSYLTPEQIDEGIKRLSAFVDHIRRGAAA